MPRPADAARRLRARAIEAVGECLTGARRGREAIKAGGQGGPPDVNKLTGLWMPVPSSSGRGAPPSPDLPAGRDGYEGQQAPTRICTVGPGRSTNAARARGGDPTEALCSGRISGALNNVGRAFARPMKPM